MYKNILLTMLFLSSLHIHTAEDDTTNKNGTVRLLTGTFWAIKAGISCAAERHTIATLATIASIGNCIVGCQQSYIDRAKWRRNPNRNVYGYEPE